MSVAARRDVVILACAISAGIHGALAPAHFEEGVAAGIGFAAGAAVTAAIGVVLTLLPEAEALYVLAVLALGGLIASYGLAAATGLPVVHPEPEPVDALGLGTKAIEAVGLVTALTLLTSGRTQTKGA